jgi:hypothetical protein
VFGDWAKGERGQILQQRHDRDHRQQKSNEQRTVSRHGPGRGLRLLLRRQRSRYGEKNIASPVVMLYQRVFALRPANDEPLSAALEA